MFPQVPTIGTSGYYPQGMGVAPLGQYPGAPYYAQPLTQTGLSTSGVRVATTTTTTGYSPQLFGNNGVMAQEVTQTTTTTTNPVMGGYGGYMPGMVQPGMMQTGMMQSNIVQQQMLQQQMMQQQMAQQQMMQQGMMQTNMMQPGMVGVNAMGGYGATMVNSTMTQYPGGGYPMAGGYPLAGVATTTTGLSNSRVLIAPPLYNKAVVQTPASRSRVQYVPV